MCGGYMADGVKSDRRPNYGGFVVLGDGVDANEECLI